LVLDITYQKFANAAVSIGTPAFNAYSTRGIVANKRDTELFAADVIIHF